jgi:hypothetical protein
MSISSRWAGGVSRVIGTSGFHIRLVAEGEWIVLRGLPVTRPSRIASAETLAAAFPPA